MHEIRRVAGSATRALRRRVLRPHQSLSELAHPREDDPEAGHFAAFVDGDVVGAITVLRRPCPGLDAADPWQLRAMAVAPEHSRRGIGNQLVECSLQYVTERGGDVVWCHARVSAGAFYEAVGFAIHGEPWDEPVTGLHVLMAQQMGGGL